MINACDLGWMPIKFGGKGAICHCKRGNCKWKKFTASKFGCEPDIEFISDQANGYSIFCQMLVKWGASRRSSLYCPMRNSDQMIIGTTHPTLISHTLITPHINSEIRCIRSTTQRFINSKQPFKRREQIRLTNQR